MVTIEFKKSLKNRDLLLFDGYVFHKNGSTGDKNYWRCSDYKNRGCRSRAATNGTKLLSHTPHNHEGFVDKKQHSYNVNQVIVDSLNNSKHIEDTHVSNADECEKTFVTQADSLPNQSMLGHRSDFKRNNGKKKCTELKDQDIEMENESDGSQTNKLELSIHSQNDEISSDSDKFHKMKTLRQNKRVMKEKYRSKAPKSHRCESDEYKKILRSYKETYCKSQDYTIDDTDEATAESSVYEMLMRRSISFDINGDDPNVLVYQLRILLKEQETSPTYGNYREILLILEKLRENDYIY